jgi:hypothetical protein
MLFLFFLVMSFGECLIAQVELSLLNPPGRGYFEPLEEVRIYCSARSGQIQILDPSGTTYHVAPVNGEEIRFFAAGAMGAHILLLTNEEGCSQGRLNFRVDGYTYLRDEGGRYERLLDVLLHSMVGEWGQDADVVFVDGKFYRFFVRWLRDHVHTLKGMKYFYGDLKSAIDLYADYQREDGMIWDNIYPRNKEKNWWDKRFRYGDFIRDIDNGRFELKRIPIENDVEFLFIEGLYFTWKASGDDAWMHSRLDHALKALHYSLNDPYRWSEKYQLLKRGFTIDTWDFQAQEDADLVGGDIMVVELGKTRFGIMFGDNTGMAVSCAYLSEMLEQAGRMDEARQVAKTGEAMRARIDSLAWTGTHYLHHIPEDPQVWRDLGVDESRQVSLSNAYSLNRRMPREQAAAIINTYGRIREEMPAGSPGEWYAIYPPFERGFGKNDSSDKWEYMNGGVTSIVAGELARGAFEHGYERYGVDILERLLALAEETDGYLHCTYRGAMPSPPSRHFDPIDLRGRANVVYPGVAPTFQGQWMGAGAERGIKSFHDIPFIIADPDEGRTSLQLSASTPEISLAIGKKAISLYLLHELSPASAATPYWTLYYADGTSYTDYLTPNTGGNWWHEPAQANKSLVCRKAWRSDNDRYVAFYVYGLNNPHPDKVVERISFHGTSDKRLWSIAGLTLSDYPVFLPLSKISHGIPDNWGAAAVMYALIEGLAGVVDEGVAYDAITISPRWTAAGVASADVLIKYPASGGYVAYRYRHDAGTSALQLVFTGNSERQTIRLLLPEGKTLDSTLVNGKAVRTRLETVDTSLYARIDLEGVGANVLNIHLR